jgi:hypothetical protein
MVPGSVAWLDLKDQYDKISYLHGPGKRSVAGASLDLKDQ